MTGVGESGDYHALLESTECTLGHRREHCLASVHKNGNVGPGCCSIAESGHALGKLVRAAAHETKIVLLRLDYEILYNQQKTKILLDWIINDFKIL